MSFWKDKPVLINGAGGFFGGWLMWEVLTREAQVIALVLRDNPQSQFALGGFARQVIIERGDVRLIWHGVSEYLVAVRP